MDVTTSASALLEGRCHEQEWCKGEGGFRAVEQKELHGASRVAPKVLGSCSLPLLPPRRKAGSHSISMGKEEGKGGKSVHKASAATSSQQHKARHNLLKVLPAFSTHPSRDLEGTSRDLEGHECSIKVASICNKGSLK